MPRSASSRSFLFYVGVAALLQAWDRCRQSIGTGPCLLSEDEIGRPDRRSEKLGDVEHGLLAGKGELDRVAGEDAALQVRRDEPASREEVEEVGVAERRDVDEIVGSEQGVVEAVDDVRAGSRREDDDVTARAIVD